MELNQESILRAAATAAENMDNNHTVPSITPQPLPTSVQLATTRDMSGNKFVILTMITPVGQSFYFLDPDSAERVADGLKETARLARTGLEIAR